MKRTLLIASALVLASTGIIIVGRQSHIRTVAPQHAVEPSPLAKAAENYASKPTEAKKEYEGFVQKNAKSDDPKVQDRVGEARMHLGYLAAKQKDFKEARATFQTAAIEYKGTGAGGDFGTVSDQAAYQAIVCLSAEGKKDEAAKELRGYMEQRPLSPLVRACYNRLVTLNGEKSTPELEHLLQVAIEKQEAHIRFETSVCGPKTIEYLLSEGLIKGPKKDYKELAKLCGTTDKGTTIEGMRKGLKVLGVQTFAFALSRKDLKSAPRPAILLQGDHYLVLKSIAGDTATVYNTLSKAEEKLKLPPASDTEYSVNAILFQAPTLSNP